ncbi:hypothetical protein AIZ20_23580, partial [Salmonella enterica subsp. enterica serovar Typhimurium]
HQTALRLATAPAAGQFFVFGIPVRQTQCVCSARKLHVVIMTVVRLDYLFKSALLSGPLVEVGIRIGLQREHFIQTLERVNNFANGLLK